MKLTKLVHSCLLIEEQGNRILVDPGSYSWQSGVVADNHLVDLDVVVITHAHSDHFDKEFIEAIRASSPGTKWYGSDDVVAQLKEWGVEALSVSSDDQVKFVPSAHAELSPWFPTQPDHASYVLFNKVLVGGDCHTLSDGLSVEVFAGAVNGGPWGGVVGYAKMIESMRNRPKRVIPLHDWHWNEEARAGIYGRLPEVMGQFGVEFVPLENGNTKELKF